MADPKNLLHGAPTSKTSGHPVLGPSSSPVARRLLRGTALAPGELARREGRIAGELEPGAS